ncbi:hypothetical protein SDC9_207462 [bioreactor metagenome]|uniref:Uncharacterized protein n=1 Tax=bioreactor metagenome TaxID=1076179 RepID=A0A645J9C2_9ZZZZ
MIASQLVDGDQVDQVIHLALHQIKPDQAVQLFAKLGDILFGRRFRRFRGGSLLPGCLLCLIRFIRRLPV